MKNHVAGDEDIRLGEHRRDQDGVPYRGGFKGGGIRWGINQFKFQVFGLAHLFGFRFASRLRDLDSARLLTMEKADRFPRLKDFLRYKIRIKTIEKNYDDVLWMGHSIQQAMVSTALIMGKIGSYKRKNGLSEPFRRWEGSKKRFSYSITCRTMLCGAGCNEA
ncbi:hypothetical protein JOD24_002515 [Kroppenstedtia sanguinis]